MAKQEEWRGKVGPLSPDEMREFLSRGMVMHLACLKDDGKPYVTPVWHEWDGEYLWVIPRQKSAWAEYLKNQKFCAVSIDETEPPYRKVLMEGAAELVESPNIGGKWVEIATRMSYRYLGENGPKYLEPTLDKPRWLFRIKPRQIKTWQGVGWAKRYTVSDSEN